jgi:acyl-coenzyme A thioesterase PaaI-like protein
MTDASDQGPSDEPMSAALAGDLASRGTAQSTALGIVMIPNQCAMRAPFRADLVGDPADGGLAGGVITTLLDQTCGMAVGWAMHGANPWTASGDGDDPWAAFRAEPRRFGTMATLDLRIDFVRPARAGCDVTARAVCYQIADNVAFVRGEAFEDDPADPIAAAQAAFMLAEPASA